MGHAMTGPGTSPAHDNGDDRPPLFLIAGPTASGKSRLALTVAARLGGEIVNADSMQIYADLRILTARPSPTEALSAPHHLFGVVDAAAVWSVGRWLAAAGEALAEIARRGRPAIVVGGTGLYFRALTRGLAETPPVPPEIRSYVQASYDDLGEAALRAALRAIDGAAEARIAPGDRQRLTRAREVFDASGRALSSWISETKPALAPGVWRGVVIDPPRRVLYDRCDARLTAMIAAGALAEVERLMARRLSPSQPILKALGVTPLAAHLRGEITLDAAIALAQQDTRRYAKRQMTWFRHQAPDWPRLTGEETTVFDIDVKP